MTRLPQGYREVRRVDLMRNRRQAVRVNLLALMITGGMTALGFVICPPFSELEISIHKVLGVLMMLAGILIYMALHEIIHGMFMHAFSGRRPHYGYTGFLRLRGQRRAVS